MTKRINFETHPATKIAMKQIADNEDCTLKDKMHSLIYDEISGHIDAANIEESDPELIEGAIRLREEQAESEREKQAEHEQKASEHAKEADEIEEDIETLEALYEEALAAQNSYEEDLDEFVCELTGDLVGVKLTRKTARVKHLADKHDRSVDTVLDDLEDDDRLTTDRFPNRTVQSQSSGTENSEDKTVEYERIIAKNTA